MELILDTADFEAVRSIDGFLTVTGVTTNPSIIAGSGRTPEEVAKGMLDVLSDDQLFFMQTIQTSYDGIMQDAEEICSLRPKNMFVKIPVTHEGLRAIRDCKRKGLGVLATAIYSADEAFLAAMNGADYLAPYVNRMCNYGDGVAQVVDLLEMLRANGLASKVVAASFKNVNQVHELIKAGIQAVTIPPAVALAMVDHPGTQIAVDEFTAAWEGAFGRDAFSA